MHYMLMFHETPEERGKPNDPAQAEAYWGGWNAYVGALAQSGASNQVMYALVLAAGLIGVLLNVGVRVLERRLLAWHSSVRSEVTL